MGNAVGLNTNQSVDALPAASLFAKHVAVPLPLKSGVSLETLPSIFGLTTNSYIGGVGYCEVTTEISSTIDTTHTNTIIGLGNATSSTTYLATNNSHIVSRIQAPSETIKVGTRSTIFDFFMYYDASNKMTGIITDPIETYSISITNNTTNTHIVFKYLNSGAPVKSGTITVHFFF